MHPDHWTIKHVLAAGCCGWVLGAFAVALVWGLVNAAKDRERLPEGDREFVEPKQN
jgi:hypothetical protein